MEISDALKSQYVARREKDLVDSVIALEQKNSAFFVRVGHQLKGNAFTFGFPELGELGNLMEQYAQFENWDQITRCAAKFKVMVESLPKYPPN